MKDWMKIPPMTGLFLFGVAFLGVILSRQLPFAFRQFAP